MKSGDEMDIRFCCIALFLLTHICSASAAEPAYALAHTCYAVQSPGSGKYLAKVPESTVEPAQTRFEFRETGLDGAESFYFQPAALGEFLLTDRAGDYLASPIVFSKLAQSQANKAAEWRVTTSNDLSTFTSLYTHEPMRHDYTRQRHWWIFSWQESVTDTAFRLVARNDCLDYPEISLNAWPAGEPAAAENYDQMAAGLRQDINQPIRGYIDAHSHMTSYEFLGGKALPGDPFHRYGVAYALDSCQREHGPTGVLDIIGGDGKAHNTAGWPDFVDWPAYDARGHSTYYYRWMQRAHLSGLKMMVVYLVENQVLCNIQKGINPVSWSGGNNRCNTMDSLRLQIKRVHEMVDYVDAQQGGPGKGFLQVVTTPQEARSAMANGKLALLLGVEASEVLDCGELDDCDRDKVDRQLDSLYQAGVRVMYPVHKFDNHFGGTSLQNGLVHLGQKLSTGHYFRTEDCDTHTEHYGYDYVHGLLMESGVPGVPAINQTVVQALVNYLGPQYPADEEQCNQLGLTELGAYLINQMIDRNMIIDLDHLSGKAAASVMDIVDSRQYGGVVSTHGWMLRGKDEPGHDDPADNRPHGTFQRLVAAGGFVSPMNKQSDRLIPDLEEYLMERLKAQHPGMTQAQLTAMVADMAPSAIPGVGIGVDMGGLAFMANPTGNSAGYPFTSEFGVVFDRQGMQGKRVFDLAVDGVAHYGMLAEHVALVRAEAHQADKDYVYHALMNSAEAYVAMWERACGSACGSD